MIVYGCKPGDPIGLVAMNVSRDDRRAKCRFCDWKADGLNPRILEQRLKNHFREEHLP